MIRLKGEEAVLYRQYLQMYRNYTRRNCNAIIRTEAFWAVKNKRKPWWI